jgi:hypothetical protein
LGEPAAAALAYVALRQLETWQGRSSVLRLARAVLERPGHGDVRDWWRDRIEPLSLTFVETTGLRYTEFLRRLERDLQGDRGEVIAAAEVSAASSPEGTLLRVDARRPPLATGDLLCVLWHTSLAPFDAAVSRADLLRQEVIWPGDVARLQTSFSAPYGSGERALVAFDCSGGGLPGMVRLGRARVTVP